MSVANQFTEHWKTDGGGWFYVPKSGPSFTIAVIDGMVLFEDNEDHPGRPKPRTQHDIRWMAARLAEAATIAELQLGKFLQ